MGLFDVFVVAAKEAAIDIAREAASNKKQGVAQQNSTNAIDGRQVKLSAQGGLLLAGLIMANANANGKSRARERYRLNSIDKNNGNSIDFKEAKAVANIKFQSIEKAFDYWFEAIDTALKSKLDRLTVMTNLVDIAMVDGEIDDAESERILVFAMVFNIGESHMKDIMIVIGSKNNILQGKI